MERTKGKWINICDNGSHAVDIMNEDATIYIGSCQGTQAGLDDFDVRIDEANARLMAAAPELDAYRQYVEDNLERIARDGWTPVCFAEFCQSEECKISLN